MYGECGEIMTIYEFGDKKNKTILLIHPAAVMWDYFDFVIPQLKNKYHLIIPALPGYDINHTDEEYTSVKKLQPIWKIG